jgi:hypothetical protein
MGKIIIREKVKLFCGLISKDDGTLSETIKATVEKFGPVDTVSAVIPFDYTGYYKEEMGEKLLRQWIGFEELIPAEELPAIKVFTNKLEAGSAQDSKRIVNIDPGYLTLPNVVLASTKNFSHRIYLGLGIYAEITLIYRRSEFTFLEWTYPDYKFMTALDFFEKLRVKYKAQTTKKANEIQ